MPKLSKKIISFDKSALKNICEALGVKYDKNIIAFTKDGVITNKDLLSLLLEIS